jgi:2-dehydropantoate 2-reductase
VTSPTSQQSDPLPPARVAVLGPGGIGGLLAALLARRGDKLTCLAPPATAAHLAGHGLELRSQLLGDAKVAVQGASRLEQPVDYLLITVKAPQLEAAVEAVPPGALGDALVVPFLKASTTWPGCASATRPTRWGPEPSGSSRPGSAPG